MTSTPTTLTVRPDPLDRAIATALADPAISPRLRRWLEKLANGEQSESTPPAERMAATAK